MANERSKHNNIAGVLVFESGKKKYCLHMDDVNRILNYDEYQQLFSHSLLLNGFFQCNNKNVHLVQMDCIEKERSITDASRLIIFGVEEYYLGLWVDRIEEIYLFEGKGSELFRTRFEERAETNIHPPVKDGVINFKGKAVIIHRYNPGNMHKTAAGRDLSV